MTEHLESTPRTSVPTEAPRYFRLAYAQVASNPNASGPRFTTLEAAREAAVQINAERRARGLQPCGHVLEFGLRSDYRGWQARYGTVALYLLDGTLVQCRR